MGVSLAVLATTQRSGQHAMSSSNTTSSSMDNSFGRSKPSIDYFSLSRPSPVVSTLCYNHFARQKPPYSENPQEIETLGTEHEAYGNMTKCWQSVSTVSYATISYAPHILFLTLNMVTDTCPQTSNVSTSPYWDLTPATDPFLQSPTSGESLAVSPVSPHIHPFSAQFTQQQQPLYQPGIEIKQEHPIQLATGYDDSWMWGVEGDQTNDTVMFDSAENTTIKLEHANPIMEAFQLSGGVGSTRPYAEDGSVAFQDQMMDGPLFPAPPDVQSQGHHANHGLYPLQQPSWLPNTTQHDYLRQPASVQAQRHQYPHLMSEQNSRMRHIAIPSHPSSSSPHSAHPPSSSSRTSSKSNPPAPQPTSTTSRRQQPQRQVTLDAAAAASRKRKTSSSSSATNSSSSNAAEPPQTTSGRRRHSEAGGGGGGAMSGPKKTAHNMIEKRYRTNLNDKIAALRDSVPGLRSDAHAAHSHDQPPDEEEEDDRQGHETQGGGVGGPPGGGGSKLNKATILSKATEYIAVLERRNRELGSECESLRERLEAFDVLRLSRGGE